MTFDFTGLVALRLNEHVLHTWDIRVARDPSAVLPPDATALVVDSLDLIARFTGKPTGRARTFTVETDEPSRTFIIDLAPDAVTFTSAASDREPDLRVSSEAFIRLVYGRLDPDHTPAIQGDPDVLDELRLVFPGP
jgi:hypothetical protein